MKRQFWLGSLAAVCAASFAHAAEVGPKDVQFVDGAIEASLTGVPGDPESGKKVMTTAALGNCVACHASERLKEHDFQGDIGPPLDGAADRWSEAELRGLVVNAKMTFEGTFMPAFYKSSGFIRPGEAYKGTAAPDPDNLPPVMSAQQVEDVVAYLMTFTE